MFCTETKHFLTAWKSNMLDINYLSGTGNFRSPYMDKKNLMDIHREWVTWFPDYLKTQFKCQAYPFELIQQVFWFL